MRFAPSLLVLSLMAASASAAPIGRILVAVGDVSAQRNGKTLPLKARAEIELGDLIKTGPASNAQIRLTDGSIIAIKPVTEFKFDDYQFTGKQDGTEKGAFSLIKGGFRTITGAIGKQNPQNYKVATPMANIGIRGTFYNLAICDSGCFNADGSKAKDGLYGGVVDGKIAVSNPAGEKTFGNDEFFHVASADAAPQALIAPPAFLQDKLEGQKQSKKGKEDKGEAAKQEAKAEKKEGDQPADKPAEAKTEEQTATVAEDSGSGFKGDSRTEVVSETNTTQTGPVVGTVDEYKAVDDTNATGTSGGLLGNRVSKMVHSEADGGTGHKLAEFHGMTQYFIDTSVPKVTGVVTDNKEKVTIEATLDGFTTDTGDNTGQDLFWGRWIDGKLTVYKTDGTIDEETLASGRAIHFIGGAEPSQLPTAATTFSWQGGTVATFSDGNGSATTSAGSITIDFGQATVLITSLSLTLSATRGSTGDYQILATSLPFNVDTASFTATGAYTSHTGGTNVLNCGASPVCQTDLAGFVSGANGNYVGLGYGIRGGITDANGNELQLSGVAGYKAP